MRILRARRSKGVILLGLLVGCLLVCIALVALIRLYPYPVNFPTFPRLTKTAAGSTGVVGDPINLVFVGSQEQITQSFHQAGWLTPDPITPQTTVKIVAASLAHTRYPTAPISNLYAFGRVQDLAFEKPTNDVQNRGHIRLWKTGTRIEGQLVWVGQTSYDSGIELSNANHFPTHHIAPTIDLERNSVGADLQTTGLVTAETSATFTTPIFFARNGGGDYYESDGDVLVITYTSVALPLQRSPVLLGGLKAGIFLIYDALLTLVTTGSGLIALAVIGGLGVFLSAGFVLVRKRGLNHSN